MSDYLHYLISNQIHECEERIWEHVKSLLGRENTEQTADRFTRILNDIVQPEAGPGNRELLPAKDSDNEVFPEAISLTELCLAMALLVSQWARESLDEENATLALKQMTTSHELLGMASSSADSKESERLLISTIAKKAAEARHAENRQLKADGLAWYAENKQNYSSKDDAAQAMTKVVPVKFRTARSWLTNI
jgi:hypothetical protein